MGLFNPDQVGVIKQGSERLIRYWDSVDKDLKKIAEIMNDNFPALAERIDNLEKKIDQLLEEKKGGKK